MAVLVAGLMILSVRRGKAGKRTARRRRMTALKRRIWGEVFQEDGDDDDFFFFFSFSSISIKR